MPLPLANGIEGLASGTALTPGSSGNTGGASGSYFDTTTLVSGGSITADATRAAHGGVSIKGVIGSTSGGAGVCWTTQRGTLTAYSGRIYIYHPSPVPSALWRIVRDRSSTTDLGGIGITTTGKLQCYTGTGTAVGTATTNSIPLDAWFRIEWHVVHAGASSTLKIQLFASMDSVTPTEERTTTLSYGTSSTETRMGPVTGVASRTMWYDDLALATTPIGPVSTGPIIVSLTAGVADSFTMSDSVARVTARSRALADSFSFSDAAIAARIAVRGVADSFTVADSIAAQAGRGRTAADSFIVSDSVARAAISRVRALSDAFSITDAVSRVRSVTRPIADSFSVSDAVSRTAISRVRSVTDVFTVSDAVARVRAGARSVADSFVMADSVARTRAGPRSVADSFSVGDSSTRAVVRTRSLSDGFSISDSATRTAYQRLRSVSDSFSVNDDATVTGQKLNLSRAVADAVTFTDSVSGVISRRVGPSDSFTVSDAVFPSVRTYHPVADAFAVEDGVGTRAENLRSLQDGWTVEDRVSVVAFRSVWDSWTVEDDVVFVVTTVPPPPAVIETPGPPPLGRALPWRCPVDGGTMREEGTWSGVFQQPTLTGLMVRRGRIWSRCEDCGFRIEQLIN